MAMLSYQNIRITNLIGFYIPSPIGPVHDEPWIVSGLVTWRTLG